MRKLLIFLTFIAIILISGYYYYLPEVRWQKSVQAAGGYPYQIGLTGVKIIPCFTSCCSPVCSCCSGGTLCVTKDVATCTMYSDVSGTPAGGMGTMALFTKTAIGQAGLSQGGQLIAGGMTMTQMDQGVLASGGGCSGCGMGKADSNIIDRIAGVVNYIIAGFKSN